MTEVERLIQGPLTVESEMVVRETIVGDTIVAESGRLVLHGKISGNLTVEVGGEAFLYGTVTGLVTNRGKAHIAGTILNGLDKTTSAITNIGKNALITGGIRQG